MCIFLISVVDDEMKMFSSFIDPAWRACEGHLERESSNGNKSGSAMAYDVEASVHVGGHVVKSKYIT